MKKLLILLFVCLSCSVFGQSDIYNIVEADFVHNNKLVTGYCAVIVVGETVHFEGIYDSNTQTLYVRSLTPKKLDRVGSYYIGKFWYSEDELVVFTFTKSQLSRIKKCKVSRITIL